MRVKGWGAFEYTGGCSMMIEEVMLRMKKVKNENLNVETITI